MLHTRQDEVEQGPELGESILERRAGQQQSAPFIVGVCVGHELCSVRSSDYSSIRKNLFVYLRSVLEQ